MLTDANRRRPDTQLEVLLVTARHRAFSQPTGPPKPEPWPPAVPDSFADVTGLPELPASELTPTLLASGLRHHGAVLVRGLIPAAVARDIDEEVERAFAAAGSVAGSASPSAVPPWFVPFEPSEGYSFGWIERHFSREIGAVLAVEAPRALFRITEALYDAGLGDLIADYLGEWPALSAKKTSLRCARPDSPTEWHQDGAFLGVDIRTVNVWTALTPCGSDAPSIDVFARRFDQIVATGTDDALFSWSVSPEQAERLDTSDVVRPIFEPGDGLFFDQMTLHRTGISPEMTRTRRALECWFFAPSTYPHEQVPIAF